MSFHWRKSSYSGGSTQSDCLEIANDLGAVRDSKNHAGPMLRANVGALVAAIKAGRFDR
jgi:hypothetical protein